MFFFGLMGLVASSVAGTFSLGPHLEWWASSARHPVAPGVSLHYSHAPSWWSLDVGVAWSTGVERSSAATFRHHFVRTHVLWSPNVGPVARQVYFGVGPALTLHQGRIASEEVRTFTAASPGARVQMGLRGSTSKQLSWGWFVGSTTVDWPRAHYDTGVTLGVGW